MTRRPRACFVGVTFAGWSTRQENLERHVRDDGRLDATFHHVDGWKDGGLLERLPIPRGARGRLRATLQARPLASVPRPDVIWTSGRELLLPHLWAFTGGLRRPLVVELDWTMRQQEEMAPWYFGRPARTGPSLALALARQRVIFSRVDLFTTMSRWAADGLREAGVPDARIRVLHPGLDLTRWEVTPRVHRERQRERGPLRLLFVGGDFVRKGGDLLLDAVSGPFAGQVIADVVTRDDVPARSGVTVHRCEPNSPALIELYASADLFVMPTRAECFGHAVVEAMASGLPAIVGDVGGIADIVDHGVTGWRVAPHHDAFYPAMADALASRSRLPAMGEQARKVAEERFDGRRNDRALVDAMLELVDQSRAHTGAAMSTDSSPPLAVPVVLFTNSPAMGGMEQHVLLLAVGLIERGVETAVVCSPRSEIQPFRSALLERGAEVHALPERGSLAGVGRRFTDLASVFGHHRGGILHVHSTGFHGGALVMLAGRAARMAGIVRTEHVPPQPPTGLRHRIQVRLRDRLLLDKAICVSESNRREHVAVLGRRAGKFTVVPNGIELERFAAEDGAGVHAELGLPPTAPLVGVVARLAEERKGISPFLRMAATVSRVDPDVHFVVVGDGPLRPSLEREAAELELTGRVSFLGERADVPRLVAALRIFVMPSLYEAGPLTLLEAMALGKAVVTTPVGVAEDVVTDGETGLIVPVGDAGTLAAAVHRLLADEELVARMGRRARETAWPAFSVDHMVDETIGVYRSVI